MENSVTMSTELVVMDVKLGIINLDVNKVDATTHCAPIPLSNDKSN